MTGSQLSGWLERYRRAWETRDADAVVALFTDTATYCETPFGAPIQGRGRIHAYWRAATDRQRDVKFSHEVLSVTGDTGIARWRAEFTREPSGLKVRLDGVFLLEFE